MQYKRAMNRKLQKNGKYELQKNVIESSTYTQYKYSRYRRRKALSRAMRYAIRVKYPKRKYSKEKKPKFNSLQKFVVMQAHNVHSLCTIHRKGTQKWYCPLYSHSIIKYVTYKLRINRIIGGWLFIKYANARVIAMRNTSKVTARKKHVRSKYKFANSYRRILDILGLITTSISEDYYYALANSLYNKTSAKNMRNRVKLASRVVLQPKRTLTPFSYVLFLMLLRSRCVSQSVLHNISTLRKAFLFSAVKLLVRPDVQGTTMLADEIYSRTNGRIRKWLRSQHMIVTFRRKLRKNIKYFAHTRRSGKTKWYHV